VKEILPVEFQWTSVLVVDWLLIVAVSICFTLLKTDVADGSSGWLSSSSEQSADSPKCSEFLLLQLYEATTSHHASMILALQLRRGKKWRHAGEWRYSTTILDFSTSWRRVVSFTPRPLCPREKNPRYPLDKSLGGPQNRSGHCGEKNLALPWIEHGSSSPSLYRLP
jgi:hypothetical protein